MVTFTSSVATRMICPECKQPMEYIEEDHFFRCPRCDSQFWMPDKSVPCPACSQPMKYFPPGCYRCPDCDGEYWPPEKETGLDIWRDSSNPLPDPPDENKARCYHRGDILTRSSGGRKSKKRPKRMDYSSLYVE